MKNNNEIIQRIDNCYVKDDYMQIMLGYRDYLLLYGNNNLMFLKNMFRKEFNIGENEEPVNVYLDDERKINFPYSSIPEHIERFRLFWKYYFTNQILDFEKPYIRMNDNAIYKVTAFKDKDSALLHTEILNNKICNKRIKTITREELETYLNTGSLAQTNEPEYKYTYIIRKSGLINGFIDNKELQSEDELIKSEKSRLIKIIEYDVKRSKETVTELENAVLSLKDLSPFILANKIMIKFNKNGDIKIDCFVIRYLERGKYELTIEDIPVNRESLSTIKRRIGIPTIETLKEPKISLFLNPNITKEQLKEEKRKVLSRNK